MKKFRLGLSLCGRSCAEEEFEQYSKAGIKSMEISLGDETLENFDWTALQQRARKFDIELWTFHLPFLPFAELDPASENEEKREHTVKYLSEKYKGKLDGKIGLIMGEEIAAEFEKWYCPDQIADLCELIVFPRYSDYSSKDNSAHNKPTGTYEGDFKVRFNKDNFKYPCTVLEKPVLPVSSTEIRSRILEKRSFKYLVPGAVYEFIQENQLYR